MNLIMLSGGGGKRLWPLNKGENIKQFVKLFSNENGESESMLQKNYRQAKKVGFKNILFTTAKGQENIIKDQIGEDVLISVEPEIKDTFLAVVLSSLFLIEKLEIKKDEIIAVTPSDCLVDDSFYKLIKSVEVNFENYKSNIFIVGQTPTFPSEKYGYIIPKTKSDISKVLEFKEKPSKEKAEEYIKMGALWNSCVFIFKASYILKKAHELLEFEDHEDLLMQYKNFPKISFDYAVLEHEQNVSVIKYDGKFKDIGTWDSFCEAIETKEAGKVFKDNKTTDCTLINMSSLPLLCVGVNDLIVAVSNDGIIITTKDNKTNIKPLIEKLEEEK